MIFRQYLHRDPIAISYFFGCGGQSQGVVVDPMEDQVDFYIQESKRLQMDIRYVIDTHLHADHISGARELAKKTGAAYLLHRSVEVDFTYTPVDDGDKIVLGNTVLTILHTPGHTPEHISIVVADLTRGEGPWFVATGHTLMIGDVGRTELANDVRQGAAQLYRSLHDKLLVLPDHVEIYPGAYSGSLCGRSLSGKPASTIGYEKLYNQALQLKTENAFVDHMTLEIPEPPAGFQQIRAYNMGHSDIRPGN
ncbi:MBL fold metallo-hydrolase [Paenibacillus radicis (ex Gao et al. 2016)]|uniref:MBL fold hydrolase n=1 Tax=Paenibacillus radicis (ex Gao et al. 2016) TaxID=1737354 RepID=A0A917LZ67_9BACL|nr:MBL fold metallo-hydrolase [Paenibacillus radicis (ex Gao et al. 2016)]GGG68567.1 MBL fold hydrolase [Paenibacillus radicis (ex Gao et al. 2016)]